MKVIILAGGSGLRLWPLSRADYPKQFLKLKSMDLSMFQATFKRSNQLTDLDQIYVVTNQKYQYLAQNQIEELGNKILPGHLLLEPMGKNTLPAIYWGVKEIQKQGEDHVAVFPADHFIRDEENFTKNMQKGLPLTNEYLVTYGIKPNKPHTGYGYIKPAQALDQGYRVQEFKEKPDSTRAQRYVKEGYLWNSGIFLFRTEILIQEVQQHSPEIHLAFKNQNLDQIYTKSPSISMDFGILEKSHRVAVIPIDMAWSDLGSFDAFFDVFPRDNNNNVIFNHDAPLLVESGNNLIYTHGHKTTSLIGVDNLIVINEKDALLICQRDQSEKVKELANKIRLNNREKMDYHVMVHKPWGSYTVLEETPFYKIKRIMVLPGKKLSYQLHHHRHEHWVVTQGTARVTLEDDVFFVRNNENIYIPALHKHRVENPGKITLEIIEVQLGEYLQEDDIVRLEDDYNR